MSQHLQARVWIETGLASLTAGLVLLTRVWGEWIEAVFGIDPDCHGGFLEWMTVGVLFAACVALMP